MFERPAVGLFGFLQRTEILQTSLTVSSLKSQGFSRLFFAVKKFQKITTAVITRESTLGIVSWCISLFYTSIFLMCGCERREKEKAELESVII